MTATTMTLTELSMSSVFFERIFMLRLEAMAREGKDAPLWSSLVGQVGQF
jgi:hypothetical protein